MPRTTVNQVASQIETHEQVCGERWKNAYERFDRIEALMEANSQKIMVDSRNHHILTTTNRI